MTYGLLYRWGQSRWGVLQQTDHLSAQPGRRGRYQEASSEPIAGAQCFERNLRVVVKVLLERFGQFDHHQLSGSGSGRTRNRDPIEGCQVESQGASQAAKGSAGGSLACRRVVLWNHPFLELKSCWQTCKASSGCRNCTLHSTHLTLRFPGTSWLEETSVFTTNSDRALLSSFVVGCSICCKARTQMECHTTSISASCCLPHQRKGRTWPLARIDFRQL